MTMNMRSKKVVSYRLMITLALIVGIVGIALQFLPDFELLSFMLTVGVLGSLIGAENQYEESDCQRLRETYRQAFAWLFLLVLVAYALIVFSTLFVSLEGPATFLNGHWPGLMLSVMCVLMGVAGLQKAGAADSA